MRMDDLDPPQAGPMRPKLSACSCLKKGRDFSSGNCGRIRELGLIESLLLRHFHERIKPKHGSIQLVRNATRARSLKADGLHVVPAAWLLAQA